MVGLSAGAAQVSDNDNTFIGYEAGLNNNGATGGTFVGSLAGQANTTGNNTFVGYSAGSPVWQNLGTNGWNERRFFAGILYNAFLCKSAGCANDGNCEEDYFCFHFLMIC